MRPVPSFATQLCRPVAVAAPTQKLLDAITYTETPFGFLAIGKNTYVIC